MAEHGRCQKRSAGQAARWIRVPARRTVLVLKRSEALRAATSASSSASVMSQGPDPTRVPRHCYPPAFLLSHHDGLLAVGGSPSVCEIQVELMTWNTRTMEF
jgi:hypothetical protein